MILKRIEEFKITSQQHKALNRLLSTSFEGYPGDRSYFKQLPTFRYLAINDEIIIGHLAVTHRMIKLNQKAYSVFGVMDICVDPRYRQQKVASQMLSALVSLAEENNIDFVILTAVQKELFVNMGFQLYSNTCRWLIINNHQSLGIKQGHLKDAILIKSSGKHDWEEGVLDFLGEIF